jgi:RNA polymerase sigma-70 factor (ECF subfamily)
MDTPPHPAESDPGDPSDVELMLRVRDHDDEQAFGTLMDRYQVLLVGFFRSMGLVNDAYDAAQETFLRLYRYRKRYEPKASLRTFIYLLARQVCMDASRKRMRRERLMDAFRREQTVEATVARGPSGDAILADALLGELPEAMRCVVVMSIYQGLCYDEIAAALEIPVGTVKSRMFNAMLRLREALHARKRQG